MGTGTAYSNNDTFSKKIIIVWVVRTSDIMKNEAIEASNAGKSVKRLVCMVCN